MNMMAFVVEEVPDEGSVSLELCRISGGSRTTMTHWSVLRSWAPLKTWKPQ
jgi:hypothetical protein